MITAELEDGTPIPVDVATVTMDDSWSPFIRATITTTTDADLAELDPTSGAPRVLVSLDGRVMNLGLRRRRINDNGTVSLVMASDEMQLHDYRLAGFVPENPPATNLRQLTIDVLSQIGLPGTLAADSGAGSAVGIDPDLVWEPGKKAWDFLAPIVQSGDLRLWCDESRVFHLTTSPVMLPGQIVVDYDGDSLIGFASDIDRDSGWCDALIVSYKWTDVLGDSYLVHDFATTPGWTKADHIEYDDTPFPGYGAAASILRRARSRGRSAPINVIADYATTPGQTVNITTPKTGSQAGWVSSVAFSEDGTMAITTRDLIDVELTAWLFDTAGVSWLDVPAGVSWAEDV